MEIEYFEDCKSKKYYYFHQCGTFASLEELGLKKLEDYEAW